MYIGAYIVFEFVGGLVVWALNGLKNDYKNYQTGPKDTYGKRVRNRIIGAVALILIFNLLLYMLKR